MLRLGVRRLMSNYSGLRASQAAGMHAGGRGGAAWPCRLSRSAWTSEMPSYTKSFGSRRLYASASGMQEDEERGREDEEEEEEELVPWDAEENEGEEYDKDAMQALDDATASTQKFVETMERQMEESLAQEKEKLSSLFGTSLPPSISMSEVHEEDDSAGMASEEEKLSPHGTYVKEVQAAARVVAEEQLVQDGDLSFEAEEEMDGSWADMDDKQFMEEFKKGDIVEEYFEGVTGIRREAVGVTEGEGEGKGEELESWDDSEMAAKEREEKERQEEIDRYFETYGEVDQNQAYQMGVITAEEAMEQAGMKPRRKSVPIKVKKAVEEKMRRGRKQVEEEEDEEEEEKEKEETDAEFAARVREREARIEAETLEKSKMRVVGGDLYTQGIRLPPHLEKWVVDERMFMEEGPRAAHQDRKYKLQVMRMQKMKQRAAQSKKRYKYDGDSVFTRRQLMVAEFVRRHLNDTIAKEAFLHELKKINIHVEEVEMTRDLMRAKVFWTTFNSDPVEALQRIQKLLPHVRRLFAKRTSHMKFCPELKFVRKELSATMALDDFNQKLDDMERRLDDEVAEYEARQ